jgi:hypothetical protein
MSEPLRRVRRLLGKPTPVQPAASAHRGSRPCVVHLVRAVNGEQPYRRFIEALRERPPGIDFDLVLAMKGFTDTSEAGPYLEFAADLAPQPLYFPDEGLDLGVYFAAAAALCRERYCFMNSYAQPRADDWLAKLDGALSAPGVGIVGATGSWASTRSWTAHVLRLPSAYRGVLPAAREAVPAFMAIESARGGEPQPAPAPDGGSRLRARLQTLRDVPMQTMPFEGFPAYHVRTNAFMIGDRALALLRQRDVRDKHDAYRMENGRDSLTRQLQRMGLRTLVVDRDGVGYDHREWHLSRTFWQGDQEGLLVEDNQTRLYDEADAGRRLLLSKFAWGDRADPVLPEPAARARA